MRNSWRWCVSYIKVGWVLNFLVPSYQFTCLLQGHSSSEQWQKHCHHFAATVLSSSEHWMRITTGQLKCWFVKIFHLVLFALNHCLLIILFIYTQIPLGYLWNYLLILKVLCILAWIIVYLKTSTEVYHSLFTTGSKTVNRLHSRLCMCRGEWLKPVSSEVAAQVRKFLHPNYGAPISMREKCFPPVWMILWNDLLIQKKVLCYWRRLFVNSKTIH